jgi:hypothetical protein
MCVLLAISVDNCCKQVVLALNHKLLSMYSFKQTLRRSCAHIFSMSMRCSTVTLHIEFSSEAMEKKYSDLYKQHLEDVTKIQELECKLALERAKQNSCRDDVLDIQAELDALKERSNDLTFTQMQIDIVRQLRGQLQQARNENKRLQKTISDMAAAGAYQDLEQNEIQKQRVGILATRL